MYARNKHTYTYNGQLYCGKGYAWRATYSPDRDHVMMDNVSEMSLEELMRYISTSFLIKLNSHKLKDPRSTVRFGGFLCLLIYVYCYSEN